MSPDPLLFLCGGSISSSGRFRPGVESTGDRSRATLVHVSPQVRPRPWSKIVRRGSGESLGTRVPETGDGTTPDLCDLRPHFRVVLLRRLFWTWSTQLPLRRNGTDSTSRQSVYTCGCTSTSGEPVPVSRVFCTSRLGPVFQWKDSGLGPRRVPIPGPPPGPSSSLGPLRPVSALFPTSGCTHLSEPFLGRSLVSGAV